MRQAAILHEWVQAFKRAAPILISGLLAGTVFGALVIAGGLSIKDGLVMSGLIYSGSAQFIGLQLITSHTDLTVILITTFLLSLRFLLYSVSLLEEVKSIPILYRITLAFGLIDEVFVLTKERLKEPGSTAAKNTFFLACVMIFYVNWILGTAIGLFLGDKLATHTQQYGFDFFAYATFIAMLAPYLKSSRNLTVSGIALLVFVLTYSLPYSLGIVVSCVSAVILIKAFDYFMKKNKEQEAI